jgi:hypothetical protein
MGAKARCDARRSRRKIPKIAAWEAGDALPTSQLERMADEFKPPVAAFFFRTRLACHRSGVVRTLRTRV